MTTLKRSIITYLEDWEYRTNGLHFISGAWARLVNVRLLKKEDTITGDLLLHVGDGVTERFDNTEYPYAETIALMSGLISRVPKGGKA